MSGHDILYSSHHCKKQESFLLKEITKWISEQNLIGHKPAHAPKGVIVLKYEDDDRRSSSLREGPFHSRDGFGKSEENRPATAGLTTPEGKLLRRAVTDLYKAGSHRSIAE